MVRLRESIARIAGTPRAALLCLALTGALLGPAQAQAEDADVEQAFSSATEALKKDRVDDALVSLEALADRGVLHPAVSYQRGLAYAKRAHGPDAQPGDLGRAASGFEESLRLDPLDADATKALELVRAEVARRRARQDKKDALVRPSPDRVLLTAVSPDVWTVLAAGAALLFAIGLLLRLASARGLRVTSAVLAPLSALFLLVLAPAAWTSRHIADTRRPGVIVATGADISDDDGKSIGAPEIPEASLVEVGERRGENILVRYGSYEGWVPARAVRVLLVNRPRGER